MELEYTPGVEKIIEGIRNIKPGVIVMVRLPMDNQAAARALQLSNSGADTLHICADEYGNELYAPNPMFLKEMK